MMEIEQRYEYIYPSLLSDLGYDVISSLLPVWLFSHNGLLPTTVNQTSHFSLTLLLSRCFLTVTKKKTKTLEVWFWRRHWDLVSFNSFIFFQIPWGTLPSHTSVTSSWFPKMGWGRKKYQDHEPKQSFSSWKLIVSGIFSQSRESDSRLLTIP